MSQTICLYALCAPEAEILEKESLDMLTLLPQAGNTGLLYATQIVLAFFAQVFNV